MASKLLYFGLFSAAAAMRTKVDLSESALESALSDLPALNDTSAFAVQLLRDDLSIDMTHNEVEYAFDADPALQQAFTEHVAGLRLENPPDVSKSLLERAASAVQSTAHKVAFEDALKGKHATECVCMLRAMRVKDSSWFSYFKLELMVPIIDFDEEEVADCNGEGGCFDQCKKKEKYTLHKENMSELGFDNVDKLEEDQYVAGQCIKNKCLCLDSNQTITQLRRMRIGTSKIDVAFYKKSYKGRKSEEDCLDESEKGCKAKCDEKDSKSQDVEGICVDEKFSSSDDD